MKQFYFRGTEQDLIKMGFQKDIRGFARFKYGTWVIITGKYITKVGPVSSGFVREPECIADLVKAGLAYQNGEVKNENERQKETTNCASA